MNKHKTHCKRGHPQTPENLYVYKYRRTCKPCVFRRNRQRQIKIYNLEGFCKHGHDDYDVIAGKCAICEKLLEHILDTRAMRNRIYDNSGSMPLRWTSWDMFINLYKNYIIDDPPFGVVVKQNRIPD